MATAQQLIDIIEACYCAALASNPNPPAQCCLVASNPVVPDCCDGSAWVRPTAVTPLPTETATRCIPPSWVLEVELGIRRCAPSTCGNLDNPCCASEDSAVTQTFHDRDAMTEALLCCLPGSTDGGLYPMMDDIIVGAWTVIDSDGACYGSRMTAQIRFYNGCACP